MDRREQYIRSAVNILHQSRQGKLSKAEFTKQAEKLAEKYPDLFDVNNVVEVATGLIWEINKREQILAR